MPHLRSFFLWVRRIGQCCFALWVTATSALLAADEGSSGTNVVVIKAGHVLDMAVGKTLERQIILIEGDTIKRVAAEGSFPISPSAKVIDLSQAWVLPGLIDCHTHITMQMED